MGGRDQDESLPRPTSAWERLNVRRILAIDLRGLHVDAVRRGYQVSKDTSVIVSRDSALLDATPDLFDRGAVVGMPVKKAARLCLALVLPEHVQEAESLSRQAWDILASHTPLVERTDTHLGYIDLTGCLRDGESLRERSAELRRQVRQEIGIRPKIGGGSTRETARIAAQQSADGYIPRMRSDERRLVQGTSVSSPHVAPGRIAKKLDSLGIRTLGEASALSFDQLASLIGKDVGWKLHRLSRCEPLRSLRANYPPRSISVSEAFDASDRAPQVFHIFERLLENANVQVRGDFPTELVVTLHPVGEAPRTDRFRFARNDITSTARAFRAERMMRDLWQGEELERIALTFCGLHPYESCQQRLWGEEQRRRRERCLDVVTRVQARFTLRSLVFATEDEMNVLAPPTSFSAEAFQQTYLCPQGCGMYE